MNVKVSFEREAMKGPNYPKDSRIDGKVVKLKTFIYVNYKDKLCGVDNSRTDI